MKLLLEILSVSLFQLETTITISQKVESRSKHQYRFTYISEYIKEQMDHYEQNYNEYFGNIKVDRLRSYQSHPPQVSFIQ